ncbi:kinase-like domain-containing protein [Paraphoma chrysanthemicola]|nr:kinase-like domain-containing protein [Paraphoma chrysanthemicola]
MPRERFADDQSQHSEDTQGELALEENQDYIIEDVKRLPLKHVDFLGTGHNTFVVKVLDTKTGAVFAKKSIRYPGAKVRGEHEESFNNEVSITRSLKGRRHIVQLFATYVTKREVGLILQPAADGGNLADYLFHYEEAMEHQTPGSDVATMTAALERAFGCLANALAYIHTQEIRHRDVKPENILMHGHSVVITDFGASKNARLPGMAITEGVVDFQTRKYSAPEVLRSERRSFEADVYSMGCVFLEVYCKLTPTMQYDGNSCFSHIMEGLHNTIYATHVSDRVDFLKTIIVSMTLQERKQRPSIDTIYQVIAQEDGFCCEDCRNEPKRISAYSFTDWEWSFEQQLYYCYLLDEAGVRIGHKWDGNPPTTIMYPVGDPRCVTFLLLFVYCTCDLCTKLRILLLSYICRDSDDLGHASINGHNSQDLLSPHQLHHSAIVSVHESEVAESSSKTLSHVVGANAKAAQNIVVSKRLSVPTSSSPAG